MNEELLKDIQFRENVARSLATIDGKIDTLSARVEPLIIMHVSDQKILREHDKKLAKIDGAHSVIVGLLALSAGYIAHIKHWFGF